MCLDLCFIQMRISHILQARLLFGVVPRYAMPYAITGSGLHN